MANGKPLTIIGSILTLLGVFILNWVDATVSAFVTGINGFMNFTLLLDTPFQSLIIALGYPEWMVYVILVLVILIALSGIMGLIGIKSKAFSAIGGLIAFLFAGILVILGLELFELGTAIEQFIGVLIVAFTSSTPVVEGIIPFNVDFAGITLGPVLIAVGGLLMLISAFMERDNF